MSKQALRKPKVIRESRKKNVDQKLIILTLKNEMKLVISCDALNGIIMMGDKYKCIFCNVDMHMHTSKEQHKGLIEHKKMLKQFPYIEELSENLIRPVSLNLESRFSNMPLLRIGLFLYIGEGSKLNPPLLHCGLT